LTGAGAEPTVYVMRADPYLEYLARFEQRIGAVAVGGTAKFNGKLIRKLNPAEFANKHDEFVKLRAHYDGILQRGDTLNDALTKILRERAAELLIEVDQ
jgi:hypothetical protein